MDKRFPREADSSIPGQRVSRGWISLRLLSALIVSSFLFGCGDDMSDLNAYVAQVKARKPGGIEPLPEVKPYQHFEYDADNKRDPFDSSVIAAAVVKTREPSNSQLSPDPNRTPEFLEAFPLDTLRMVGTLEQKGTRWALIKTPDKTIQRVARGNYIGQNYGKIKIVTELGIDLTEIIPDGFGGWRERETYVALSE